MEKKSYFLKVEKEKFDEVWTKRTDYMKPIKTSLDVKSWLID